jgi:class I fructose-bisphosphate aldolase
MRNLQRFFRTGTQRALVLALDHGVSEGMAPGLAETERVLAGVDEVALDGVVLHKGLARTYAGFIGPDKGLVVQLSGATRHGLPPYNRTLVCSVPQALRLGADAVALQINIGNDLEDRMLADFAVVSEEAQQHGLPVFAFIRALGGQIVNEVDPALTAHCVRLGGELGADVVCAPYSGEPESFAAAVGGCPAPVLVSGGPAAPDFDTFLSLADEALQCGAAGLCLGRMVLGQPKPAQALSVLARVVHGEEE